MSTVIARRIKATPVRTSSEAWDVICKLLAPDPASPARAMLDRASGVAGSAIASEVLADDAMVLHGSGARVRCYCLYDEDALSGEDASESALPEVPATGDWRLSIPVLEEDYDWSARAVKPCAPHITVRKAGDEVPEDSEKNQTGSRATVRVNLDGFLKP